MTPDPIYRLENVPLFEALYGENLISLGAFKAIDNMFSDIDLKGLNILDVGFGLGGVAFYLAKKFNIHVSGVEVHEWMAEYAENHAPKEIAHLVKFTVYDQGKIPFAADTFDLVYSKGVLNHVKDKEQLFKQINSVLKLGGAFVIADWVYPKPIVDHESPLVCETKESYKKILENSGFKDINYRDDSEKFLNYVEKFLENLNARREFIEEKYGKEIFTLILNDHQKLIRDINDKQKIAIRIIAR